MTKRFVTGISLLILFTTFISQKEIVIKKFNIQKIQIKNNSLLAAEEIKKELASIYNKNLIFLNINEVEKILKKNTFIESFYAKKIYPNTLIINIYEKKPNCCDAK